MHKQVRLLVPFTFAAAFAGCASPVDTGWPAGKFVTLRCADNKSFQARLSEDSRTVRVRSHHGSAELESRGEGRFAGGGYALNLKGEGGAALEHDGKSQGQACKVVA